MTSASFLPIKHRQFTCAHLDLLLLSLTDLISLFSFLWFVLGNFWVFSSLHTCRATSPELWWGSMASLIISYLRAVEILAIVLAVVFFLPGQSARQLPALARLSLTYSNGPYGPCTLAQSFFSGCACSAVWRRSTRSVP